MKTDLSYMSMDQASKILDYRVVPESKEKRIELTKIMGYTKVNKVNSLANTPNYQLREVARKLLKDAEKKTRQYWDSIDNQVLKEDAQLHELDCSEL